MNFGIINYLTCIISFYWIIYAKYDTPGTALVKMIKKFGI